MKMQCGLMRIMLRESCRVREGILEEAARTEPWERAGVHQATRGKRRVPGEAGV